ncbi:uncharacterized protein LOC129950374 [Eupeodes corollae]|uniref:uncharacterized protein LOC129950374 n=1 Tax=Eupeodes corollae TaxID=290404 RepID=UPI0024911E31|nr:uncharacterized protein LOC129950374 [Eupeodes corollae]
MDFQKDTHKKNRLLCPLIWAIISTSLFLVSLIVDFQHEAIKEHVRFRKGFPSRTAWEHPPDCTLKFYLFNVTNSEAFLNGTDKKLHVQQIGPIIYRVKIGNTDIDVDEKESTMTFRKLRGKEITFDEENSPPGILDQKIIYPNVVLLSMAAKLHDWFVLTRNLFNMYAKNEPIFVHHTVNELLWNYTTPLIENVRPWVPGVVDNAGTLYNAFRETKEVYKVNIGLKNGMENFFKVRSINNLTVFGKQLNKQQLDPETCPVHVANAFDNTLYPPGMQREDRFSIIAADSCRTLPMVYDSDVDNGKGLSGYKFVMDKDKKSSCLRDSMDIPLPEGMFDVSSCHFGVPASYSQPHFFGSSYNFEEHIEGLSPNEDEHQTHIFIEPKIGVLFGIKHRFMQSIPMPHLNGFSEGIRRFNGMFVPTFWYEYDIDDLPFHATLMLKTTAYYIPYFQKLCIIVFLLGTVVSLTTIICRKYGISPREVLWFGHREMQQTISEVPKYYDDSKSFLPKNAIKVYLPQTKLTKSNMSLTTSQKPLQVESQDSLQSGQKKKIGCAIFYFVVAFISVFFSVISLRYDFLELALNERIKLRPGLPPFEKWRNPSNVKIAIKLNLFAVENPTEFLADNNVKLKLKEIGPIYYKKIMNQEDIVFHEEDSTMSYSTVYRLEFVEEMNEPGILNKTITIINPVILGLAAMIHDQFLAKVAFDFLADKDHVFINRTVYEALWNSTSPMLEIVKQIPFAAARPNAGIMFNSFYPTPTRYNVNIGPKHGYENFFKINTLNGLSSIQVHGKNFPEHCPFSLKGASEGTGLPPRLTKDTVIKAFTNNLCRTYPMVYNRTVKVGPLDTYEFVFASDIYKRNEDPEKDCLRQTGGVILPDGLIDSSKCAFGTPVALSNPHFLGFHGEWENYIEGLEPSEEKHSSHILVEPTTGIQLEAIARMQSNIALPSLEYYPPEVKRFSKMILPQFWMEYSVSNDDKFIRGMIVFFINMPVIQPIIVILLLTLSLFSVYRTVKLMMSLNMKKSLNLKKQKVIVNNCNISDQFISAFSDNSFIAL